MPLLFRGRRATVSSDVEDTPADIKADSFSERHGFPQISRRHVMIMLLVLTMGSFVSAWAFRRIAAQLTVATTALIADNIALDRSVFAKAGANTALRESIAAPLRRLTSERQAPGHLAVVRKHLLASPQWNLSFADASCPIAWRRAPLAAAAAAASVPAVVVDNTDCFMGPSALSLETPTHEVMPQERPLTTGSGFDCYAWARFGVELSADGHTRIVQPELPLNFAQSHAYVARLADAQGFDAYLFAHSDANVQLPAVFHALQELAASRAKLFGGLQPCAVLTNYDVLALYFPRVLRDLGGGSDGVPGFDWRLWYFGDNDLASRCHDAGYPFVTLPQLAPFVGHVRSGTLKSGLPGDSEARRRRYDFYARYYSWKWAARLRASPAQERVRLRIPLKAVAVELTETLSLASVVDAVTAAFEACCQHMPRLREQAFTCRGAKPVQVRLVSPDLDTPGWQTWAPPAARSRGKTPTPLAGRWRVAMVMLALNAVDRSARGSPTEAFTRLSSHWKRTCSSLIISADRCDALCEATLAQLCSSEAIIAFEHAHEPIVGADLAS